MSNRCIYPDGHFGEKALFYLPLYIDKSCLLACNATTTTTTTVHTAMKSPFKHASKPPRTPRLLIDFEDHVLGYLLDACFLSMILGWFLQFADGLRLVH